jgi:hypothetical protein
MTSEIFERPAKRDIDHALSILMHEARRGVMDQASRVTSESIQRGALKNRQVALIVAEAADKIHADSMKQARQVLLDFIERIQAPATQITGWARPHLDNLSNSVLGAIPPFGFPADHQRVTKQYKAIFQQRVDGTLRNVEIGYIRGAGFSARATMPEEEWISAADAVALLKGIMAYGLATRAICKRAHAGLMKARAVRFICGGQAADNTDIPAEMWWADGEAALTQNWATGDFETWINNRELQLQAYGVTFRRSEIESMLPAQPTSSAPAPAAKAAGGRPKASWSDDLWIEMCRQLYDGDLKPKRQRDITKAMMDWLSARGEDAAESTIKERARKLWAVIGKDEN